MQSHIDKKVIDNANVEGGIMPSLQCNDNDITMQKTMWLLAAIALNAVELALPRLPFFPWLKPGFANVITVLWIMKFGFRDATLFTALRVWISGFYFGFSLFTFCLSLSGGLLSVAVMSILWKTLGKRGLMGTVGIAVMGALFHNIGQLAVVYFMMAQNMNLFWQIPFMLGTAVIFGSIVGMIVPVAAAIFDDMDTVSANTGAIHKDIFQPVNFIDKFIIVLTFTISIALMFINNVYVLIVAAIVFSIIPIIINPKNSGVIFYPAKFYLLFIFIAITSLFFSYGTRMDAVPFITQEGLSAFIKQSLRLWCWLQTIHIFRRFNFNEMFVAVLHGFFPNRKDTLKAGMAALKHFPEVIRFTKLKKKIPIAALPSKSKAVLAEYINSMYDKIKSM